MKATLVDTSPNKGRNTSKVNALLDRTMGGHGANGGSLTNALPSKKYTPLQIETADELIAKCQSGTVPPHVIEGLLRRGDVGVYGGGAKIKKTFWLLQLGWSVCTGESFLGMETNASGVLFVNFELSGRDLADRLSSMSAGRTQKGDFVFANLRDDPSGEIHLEQLRHRIVNTIAGRDIGLIILDPLYECIDGGSENDPEAMHSAMHLLRRIAKETEAAVLVSHHFPKGDRSKLQHFDRMSGSSVLSRAPDMLATATRHKEKDCFALEFTTRHFPDPPPLVMEWRYPHFFSNDDLDPAATAVNKQTLEKQDRLKRLLMLIPPAGVEAGALREEGLEKLGVSVATYHNYLKTLIKGGRIEKRNEFYYPFSDNGDLEKEVPFGTQAEQEGGLE